jgi:hypothetical protein
MYFEKRKCKLEIQAQRLISLAKDYKNAGYIRDAICEIKRSLQITKNEEYEALLKEWEEELGKPEKEKKCPYGCGQKLPQRLLNDICPKCNRFIKVCKECEAPNRLFDPYCRSCGIKISDPPAKVVRMRNVVLDWFYPMPFEHLSPPPVMVADLIVIPAVKEKKLLALKVTNGEVVWKLEHVPILDEYVMVSFCHPYLYIYNTKRIERLMIGLQTLRQEAIYDDSDSMTSYPSFPLIDEKTHTILFSVNKGLLSHDIRRKRGKLSQMVLEENDTLFPIAMEGSDSFILSRKGSVYKLFSDRLEPYHYISNNEFVSPPVSPIGSNWVYFEGYRDGKRMINAWARGSKKVFSKKIPDTLCSAADIHFHRPPIAYEDGVILISCQKPKIYYGKAFGNDIDLKEIEIDIGIGAKRVVNIEYLFSLVIGTYFISRIADGFFYVNLEDCNDNGLEFFRREMISKPLIFRNRLILLCNDGVRCYTF